jgi:hypothetical protein
MNREKYLALRRRGIGIEILYEAAKDLSGYSGSLYHFSNSFTVWLQPTQVKQNLLTRVTDHYDKKFHIVLTSYNNQNIKID